MPNYLKPQSPLYHKEKDTYFYPLTTADQVITSTGERLNSLFKKTIRESATLRAADWSETLPYTQTITLTESIDDYNVDVNIAYNDIDNMTLNKAAGYLSYIKKNHKDITFYCLKSKPTIDIPIEIAGTCRNTIATVEEGTKLNFDIKRYNTEEELLADTPMENTIGIVTTTPISKWIFDSNEPENPVDGMLWIKVGTESQVEFNVIKDTDIPIYPISAEQYVNGAWVDKTAKSYLNGEWVDWIIWLFNYGRQRYTWSAVGKKADNAYNQQAKAPTVSKNDDGSVAITMTGGTASLQNRGGYMLDEPLDLSPINRLRLNATIVSTGGYEFGLYVNEIGTSYYHSNLIANAFVSGDEAETKKADITLDVSGISGKYDIFIPTYASKGTELTVTLREVYGE